MRRRTPSWCFESALEATAKPKPSCSGGWPREFASMVCATCIGRLAANLSGATRVDLCICDERGVEQVRLADIPVHSGASSIAFQEPIALAKAAP